MRAAGFVSLLFCVNALFKLSWYIHTSVQNMCKINASRLSWETRWQLTLTMNFWQSITKLIWIPENVVYKNHITDYSNRTEWAIDKPWPCQFNSRMHKYFSLVYAPVLHLQCFKTKLTPMFNMEKHSRYCRF